ncbi:MAG: sigma 54-interacting transcriptional regulator [Pirellulaceae bacterium]|nr:sigma 54-interacting transcriptional regulator [Pirellulaceae bacterium]
MSKRILVTWIGHADLSAFSRQGSPSQKHLELIHSTIPSSKVTSAEQAGNGVGPIKALVEKVSFSQIHLIGNYEKSLIQQFGKWLKVSSVPHSVSIVDPSDHSQIYGAVKPILEGLKLDRDDELSFHLSPGTPAMHAIWVLLGKSLYPAKLYQTYKDKAKEYKIPFDITVDLLPQYLREPDRLWQQLDTTQEIQGFESIVGSSPAINEAKIRAQRAAIHDVPLLILGESGTGKEMFAEAMHRASSRRDKPMSSINCAAISKELIESELFGHVKGAFTGADKDRKGLFAEANGSTLFLDEVGECDLGLQAKLLRALQPPHDQGPCHRVFRPVGATADQISDVRVIAATNKDLLQMVRDGTFREDLLYRLATITLKLPPLRERGKDVITVAESMLAGINAQFRKLHAKFYVEKSLSAGAKAFVRKHTWPGNVRELRNALIQAAVMSSDKSLSEVDFSHALSDLPGNAGIASEFNRPLGDGFDIEVYLDEIRKRYLLRAMKEANGIKIKAAELLGLKSHQVLTNHLIRLDVQMDA